MKRVMALTAALAAVACAPTPQVGNTEQTDVALAALMAAAPEACPPDQVEAGFRTSGPSEGVGITAELMATAELNGEFAGHVLRTRRIIIAPGGELPWHAHDARQGLGIIVSGVFTEYQNDCRVELNRGPGSISRETESLAHYWRNEGEEPVILIAVDVVPAT